MPSGAQELYSVGPFCRVLFLPTGSRMHTYRYRLGDPVEPKGSLIKVITAQWSKGPRFHQQFTRTSE